MQLDIKDTQVWKVTHSFFASRYIKKIKKYKSKCKSYVCDITNYDEIKTIINKQIKIDILINNAGNNIPEHFTKVKTKNMEYLVKINIRTNLLANFIIFKMLFLD